MTLKFKVGDKVRPLSKDVPYTTDTLHCTLEMRQLLLLYKVFTISSRIGTSDIVMFAETGNWNWKLEDFVLANNEPPTKGLAYQVYIQERMSQIY